MNKRYVAAVAVIVLAVIVGGAFVLSGIEFEAPSKSVEIVIPNDRFAE